MVHIEEWRNRKLSVKYPYVYVDGIYLKHNWGGRGENISVLVAIGVREDGYREVIGAAEGMKEDAESWKAFMVWLKERRLNGVKFVIGDIQCHNGGFLEAKYQRVRYISTGTFSLSRQGNTCVKVIRRLKAIHAQECKEVVQRKHRMSWKRLNEAAKKGRRQY